MAARAGNNPYPQRLVKEFVKELEDLEAEKVKLHMAYMAKCAKINEQKNDVLDTFKEKGLPKKAMKKVVQIRAAEEKARKMRDDLETEEQDQVDLLRQQLGDLQDTELGAAALARMAERQKGDSEAVDSLAG